MKEKKLDLFLNKFKRKIVIWDLFGGGCNSLSRWIIKDNLEKYFVVYTFDVVETHKESFRGQLDVSFQHYINQDLSIDNIVEVMKRYPKPDIILSSTLCQSFSNVLSMVGGGTCFWKQEIRKDKNSKLIERSIEEFEKLKHGFTRKLNAEKQLFVKRLGEKCAINSVKLIKYFKPKFWYIENPASSLLFQFLKVNMKLKGYLNVACFGAYNFPQNKSGGFYSNVKIDLSTNKREPTYETQWEDITKKEYEDWIKHVEEFKKIGSSGDKRVVRFKNGKYQRRWYVDKGYKIGDKGHCSLKKTCMTLGKLTKNKFQLKSEAFSVKQLGEANETSHIPSGVIKSIIFRFIDLWNKELYETRNRKVYCWNTRSSSKWRKKSWRNIYIRNIKNIRNYRIKTTFSQFKTRSKTL